MVNGGLIVFNGGLMVSNGDLPSGKHLHNGKTPCYSWVNPL
jgi:hypothetical protein